MIEILRSMTWSAPGEESEATTNLTKVRTDRLLSLRAPESALLEFVLEFYTKYTKAPELRTLRDFADDRKDPEITKIVDNVELGTFYKGADFEELVEREVKTQGISELTTVCKEAIQLVLSGKKTLEDAVGHLYTTLRVPPSKSSDKLPVSLKRAVGVLEQTYQLRKTSPANTYGVMTGYGVIDQSTAGVRKKQLYFHAAFPGHLKSTMIMNMIVNASVDYGWNELLFTAEMPANDTMLMLVAIHSANRKFNGIHRPLSKFRLLLGKLDSGEEKFFKEVMDDLVNNPDHGSIRVVDSADFSTLGSIIQRTTRESATEEVDQVWIDYLTRLPVDAKYAKMQLTEARNETIADAKRFAMSFNGGVGLAVCSAFQTNRESYKKAKENGGKYDKTCLGQYNAAEKEADIITYTWFDDEERKISEPKLGILKSRWGEETTDLAALFIERDSRRIFDMTQGLRISASPTQAPGGTTSDVEL